MSDQQLEIIGKESLLNSIADRIYKAYSKIQSFDDIVDLLKGEGLSMFSLRTYVSSYRAFYIFTEGKSPYEYSVNDLERHYDFQKERLQPNSLIAQISGLKKIFGRLEETLPYNI